MAKRFIHPVHARGVQCSKIDGNVGGPLTDGKIKKYILRGYYGEERRNKELASTTKSKRTRTNFRQSPLDGIEKVPRKTA